MSRVLILKNITREGPGLVKNILEEHSVDFVVVDLDAGDDLKDVMNYSALIILGGPDSANDDTEKMVAEIDFVKKALENNVPCFGICLGLQVLVKAGGGSVVTSTMKEVGFKDQNGDYFELVKEKDDDILENVSFPRPIFHLHGEMVEITDSMELIASGKWCRNQLVKIKDKAYGVQGHLELTKDILESWMAKDPDLQTFDTEELLANFGFIKKEYEETARQFFGNWLRIAGLVED